MLRNGQSWTTSMLSCTLYVSVCALPTATVAHHLRCSALSSCRRVHHDAHVQIKSHIPQKTGIVERAHDLRHGRRQIRVTKYNASVIHPTRAFICNQPPGWTELHSRGRSSSPKHLDFLPRFLMALAAAGGVGRHGVISPPVGSLVVMSTRCALLY